LLCDEDLGEAHIYGSDFSIQKHLSLLWPPYKEPREARANALPNGESILPSSYNVKIILFVLEYKDYVIPTCLISDGGTLPLNNVLDAI
jgi:hypothetical protein